MSTEPRRPRPDRPVRTGRRTAVPPPRSEGEAGGGAALAPPLWKLLQSTAEALQAVRDGQSGTAALADVAQPLRPGVQALLFQALRNLGRAQALRRHLAPRNPPPRIDALLCTALALAWSPQDAPYEPFTLVNQAVEAAKRNPSTQAQSAFVNACLRRFLRERDTCVAATDGDPVARWNHPAWWIERLRQDHPQHWQRILEANNAHAPMTLRVARQKSSPARYLQELAAMQLDAIAVGADGIELRQPQPVQQLPGFADGVVSVQDSAAQQAAPLLLDGLDLSAPLRLLDACAAPGGKTAHLLECQPPGAAWRVTALEVDPLRAERIHDTLRRLKLSAAQVLVADAARVEDWWPQTGGEPFDAILLDAPCTASGIVRRHPDVRWLRRASDIAQLAALQAQLLARLWPLVRPGGRLLYCTCSVFRAEGDAQVQAFLQRNTDARLMPSPGHLIPGRADKGGAVPDNPAGDHDGFFYALFHKAPA